MLSKAWILLPVALASCTPTRPNGAYEPDWDSSTCIVGFGKCPGEDAGDGTSEDTGVEPDMDSGVPNDPDSQIIVKPDDPLGKLVGRYLMRVDYYSIDVATETVTLELHSRVSNLFITTLTSDGSGNKLTSSEQLCFQNSAHDCKQGCTGAWTTTYAPGLPAVIKAKSAPLQRNYIVDAAGNLTVAADAALLTIGYSDPAPSKDTIATATSDSRVWSISSTQFGVPTLLSATLAGGLATLNCQVDSTLLFSTAFKAKLGSDLTADKLATLTIEVDPSGSAAHVMTATGTPTGYCTPSKLNSTGGTSSQRAFVTFKKLDPAAANVCPASAAAFDQAFPPKSATEAPTPTDPL